ncbi:MAG: sulfatase-like hydrolase/transferase, partial [Burkholderiales bacterium]|nr:sulfatase-like hydrolase/transferase [Burkholderiales bacterium]
VLLPVFQRLLKQSAPKKLFVIHTLGSHKRYDQRYPPEFKRFEPAGLGKLVTDPPEAVVNSYDNSILFTDHVLAELITTLERTGPAHSALMYLSDHGQTLPLNGCQEDGHGRRNEADFRVAALLWVSASFDRAKPQVLQQAGKRRDASLESVGAFHALAELADVSFPDWQPERSWISTSWQPRTRWTNAVPDFDNALRESPCGKLKMP